MGCSREPLKTCRLALRAFAVVIAMTPVASHSVEIEMVTVGDPWNPPDTSGYGTVRNVYYIGKYEVTNAEYSEFLNAVAAGADPNDLYDNKMGSGISGGILRTGAGTESDPWNYLPRIDYGHRPVNYVSWFDTLRFANWLHNGQPTGSQDATTTEDGAYDISLGAFAVRKSGALYWLPSDKQWYKAAYYDPSKPGLVGDFYWHYPTQSNAAPTGESPPGADLANGSANLYNNGYADPVYTVTEVGRYNTKDSLGNYVSDSYYGTFDQGGNVWEWTETECTWGRWIRGGAYNTSAESALAWYQSPRPETFDSVDIGFRIASVPEPSTWALLLMFLPAALLLVRWRKP